MQYKNLTMIRLSCPNYFFAIFNFELELELILEWNCVLLENHDDELHFVILSGLPLLQASGILQIDVWSVGMLFHVNFLSENSWVHFLGISFLALTLMVMPLMGAHTMGDGLILSPIYIISGTLCFMVNLQTFTLFFGGHQKGMSQITSVFLLVISVGITLIVCFRQ